MAAVDLDVERDRAHPLGRAGMEIELEIGVVAVRGRHEPGVGEARAPRVVGIDGDLAPLPLGPCGPGAKRRSDQGQSGVGGAMKVLQNVVSDKKNELALRIEGVSALAGTRAGTEWLLALNDKNGLDDAIKQYRTDRDPKNITLARRAVVHFAADPLLVSMTTRLAGQSTQFTLQVAGGR